MNQSFFSPLPQIRRELEKMGLKAVLIRSTDRYFNEYIPKAESPRARITGFDGSVGDAIITKTSAHLFVDGRYSLQAKTQAPDFTVHVCANNQSIENNWLNMLGELSREGTLAYDPATLDMRLFNRLEQESQTSGIKLSQSGATLIHQAMEMVTPKWKLTSISTDITGLSTEEKINQVADELGRFNVSGLLVVKLDDIAWLLNMRSDRFPFQASVPGIAALMGKKLLLGLPDGVEPEFSLPKCVNFVKENDFFSEFKTEWTNEWVLGIDENETSKAHESGLQELQIKLRSIANPIATLKAIKNEKELTHMREAFHKADQVVYKTQGFVVDSFEKGQPISEGEVDDHVKECFFASGATDLSFRPICASGKNGAFIHYGTPDRETHVERGALFLLDTGAYYQGGYATDLTRTFLAAPKNHPAESWQKEMFTLVLIASIKGLCARIRRGTTGMQLDAIVREPLWQRGLDFAHGTGHGVGINVHEFPPRVGPTSTSPLLPSQVFSIEPGLYFEGLGGVRIENLATVVPDPDDERFVRVLPLTFCPFDERLIEEKMLGAREQEFLRYYRAQWQNGGRWPELPPLSGVKWAGK